MPTWLLDYCSKVLIQSKSKIKKPKNPYISINKVKIKTAGGCTYLVNEQILWFQVSMQHIVRVTERQTSQKLVHERLQHTSDKMTLIRVTRDIHQDSTVFLLLNPTQKLQISIIINH